MSHLVHITEMLPSVASSVDKELVSSVRTSKGHSSKGVMYTSVSDMWKHELSSLVSDTSPTPDKAVEEWYNKGAQYWEDDKVPATIEGVLGGYGSVSPDDISESLAFLRRISKKRSAFSWNTTVDCGSGIGRVAQNLLIPNFSKVDIVEQSPKLINEAKKALSSDPKIGSFNCIGLQQWLVRTKYICVSSLTLL
jgi:protein N-terminal methyltransferase